MKAILILGHHQDPIIQKLCQTMVDQYPALYLIEPHLIGSQVEITSRGILFKQDASFLPHDHIGAVFNRAIDLNPEEPKQAHMLSDLLSRLDLSYPYVMNRPKDQLSNFSKPAQMQDLAKFSSLLKTPKSMICFKNKPQPSYRLTKPISSVRSEAKLHQGKFHDHPALYQHILPGLNIRVHTIDEMVIATSIQSHHLDYRYASCPNLLNPFQLPKRIQEECIKVTRDLNLYLSGIDLILYQNDFYILEANTAPGYDYFDQYLAGEPINHAIAHWLIERAQR